MDYENNVLYSILQKSCADLQAKSVELKHEIIVGALVLLAVYFIFLLIKKIRSNFPPGPIGLPIVGYLPFLSDESFLDLIELGKKYGDVFSITLGSEKIVILHGPEAIKEAFSKPEFSGRPSNNSLEIVNAGSAFFTNDIHTWKEQRRFVVQSMKDLGLGKTKIESEIQDEVKHFLEVLRSHNGQKQDIKKPLSASMSNNISALVFGKRFDYDDPKRIFFGQNDGHWPGSFIFDSKEVEKHKKTLDPRNTRDFIDSFLLEMKLRQQKHPDTTFTESTLLSNVVDLFTAGSETVRTSILWSVYIMAAYPEEQNKVQKEILNVIGSERDPEFLDIKSMPYTHAVILEIMRWKTIVPLNVMRYTLEDTTVGGYDIPKNTIVIANFWNAHHDPRYWSEPDTFKPDRFISKDGSSVVKSNNYMAFSLGRRACPGETMAYMEIFLYLVSMLQKFDIVFPENTKPTFEAKSHLIYRKEPYDVRFIPRN